MKIKIISIEKFSTLLNFFLNMRLIIAYKIIEPKIIIVKGCDKIDKI